MISKESNQQLTKIKNALCKLFMVVYIAIACATPLHAWDNISYVDRMDRVTGSALHAITWPVYWGVTFYEWSE